MADNGAALPKRDRLRLFFDRLNEAKPSADHDSAMALLADTLNVVEDQFSGVPYNVAEPGTDGRMYPPNERFRYMDWERAGVRCYRQTRHTVFVADNGALEVRSRTGAQLGEILFEKPGQDGRKVSDYESSA